MYDLPLPACRQFLCTHRDLRTCYRRAEKRCWVRDSCKPPGCTSPPRLHQPPHACPAQPSIHPSFSRTFSSLPPSLLASTPCYKTPLLSVSPRSQLVFSAWISPIIFFFSFFFPVFPIFLAIALSILPSSSSIFSFRFQNFF